jgi:bacillithiol synthase
VRVHSEASAPSTDSSRVPVDIRRFPWIRQLAADFAYNFPALAPFLAGSPADPAAWAGAIERARRRSRDHGRLAAVIAAQQRDRGAPAPAREAASRLADPATVAVVTGQQAGLFGGPLYTLLKALTAIRIATDLTRDDGTPAVAVFWIDGEDHDWDEVRACPVLDDHLEICAATLPPRGGADLPVGRATLDRDGLEAAFAVLEHQLPATEFRGGLLAGLREAYRPGAGMAQAFGQWLETVLGDRGLVVFDASDPAAKPLAADVLVGELSAPGETTRLARQAGAALTARGYHAQVDPAEDSVALFRLGPDGSRQGIRLEGGRLVSGGASFDPATLVEEARSRPSGFSPNVLLRPVVQDAIFPTVCYVAGPSELAYLAQLRTVYERFDIPMPLVCSRASATITDAAAARFLSKYGVALEALQPQDDAALNALLQSQIPPEVEAAFTTARDRIAQVLATIAEGVASIDPTLRGTADSTLGRMHHDLETLHHKMIAAAKRRDETLRRQFSRTRALAFPGGVPQERAVGFIWFLNQYGPALVDRLADALPLDQGVHWVVTI